jgi:glucosylceramidase
MAVDYYQSFIIWANYVKFIDSYQKRDSCLGLTVKMNQWQSKHGNHVFIRQRKSVILSNYLGPTLKNAGLGDKKLRDHNRDLLSQRASTTGRPTS